MKQTHLIITVLMLIVGCSKPIDDETLIEEGGLKYHPETMELYSGDVFKYYLGGKTEYEGSYKDGKQDGKWTSWYENRQKKGEEIYKDGKQEGLLTGWHKNGQKEREGTYKNGELIESTWRDKNGVKITIPPDMVYVAGGTFQMGSNSDDDDEKPVHTVTVSSFYMDKTEVTQAEYRKVMGINPSSLSGCDDCPVEQVNWYDANEYAKKVGKRLPTEAEWEYAARGGNKSKGYTYSGSNSISSVGWYGDNSGYKTHPVAQKQPNELGLYDMSGNVYELY